MRDLRGKLTSELAQEVESKLLGCACFGTRLSAFLGCSCFWMFFSITPTSTPNSRLYSIGLTLCLFSLNATRDPNRCAVPLWFHSILNPNGDDMHVGFEFESFVYVKPNGGTRSVRFQSGPGLHGDAGSAAIPAPVPLPASPGVPAPAPAGLHHDYGQIHHLCNALRR